MKACIVNPPWEVADREGIRAGCRFPNLTYRNTNRYVPFPFLVAYTASYLESRGIEVLAIDGCAERCSVEAFCDRIRRFGPDILIAETSTTSLAYDIEMLAKVRQTSPGLPIAVYGSHTDARPEDALVGGGVDYVIQGEPELTSLDLLRALCEDGDVTGVAGVVRRDSEGRIIVGPKRVPIADLDALPYPKRDAFPMETYHVPGFAPPVAFMYAGRGCSYRCTFCLWPQTTLKGVFRPRSGEAIVAEMAWVLEHYPRTRSFFFDDDTFNLLGKHRMLAFADAMDQRGLRIPWGCNARSDNWDREVLERLVATGLFTLRIGIESGDQRVLDRTGKGIDLEEARAMLKMSDSLGIQNHIMFVIGLPGETHESVENTIHFIKSVPCHSVQFSVATPFPGTSFYREAQEKGHLVTDDWSKYSGFDHVVVRTDELDAEAVGRALAQARRSIYFSPRFIRKRIGYIRSVRDVSALARKALRLVTSSAFNRAN
jgi:anaerobic magnesium-protoporphyrin IX monomethyl ester cyclase